MNIVDLGEPSLQSKEYVHFFVAFLRMQVEFRQNILSKISLIHLDKKVYNFHKIGISTVRHGLVEPKLVYWKLL